MSATQKRKRSEVSGLDDDRPEPKRLSAACTACRKQKIKCDMANEEPPCSRCQKRGMHCVLHTAQRHPVVDHRQVGLLGKDMISLHSTLDRLCQQLGLEAPPALLSDRDTATQSGSGASANEEIGPDGISCELSPPESPSTAQAPIDAYLTSARQETSPNGTIASPHRSRRKTGERSDLIGKGLVSVETAEMLVNRYLLHLDRFLYGIASQYQDLKQVRQTSPVLLAAMCAVAAFHDAENRECFEVCNQEYRRLVSESMFEKRDIEFIRALCIGSFWLPDASRILLSEAIRRAADHRLHRHFHGLAEPYLLADSTATASQQYHQARDRIRLWYLLYVCDQHLSILHNRDCILRPEKDAIESRELFVVGESSMPSQDIRIMSQVFLLFIMGQIKDVFGSEQSKPLGKSSVVQLSHFARELDQWYSRWSQIFGKWDSLNIIDYFPAYSFDTTEPDNYIGSFPLAGLTMHFQFSKLYLGHHVFRGLKTDPIPPHFLPAATSAREAAVTIFSMVMENEAFRSHIVGMPAYFHIMISFAGHVLLEVCLKYREQLNVMVEEDFRLVSAALAVFARTPVMPTHPISRVTAGLMRKLNECTAALGMESVLTESPFGNGEYAAARDFTTKAGDVPMPSTFDLHLANGLPDDLLYAEFGDLTFPDSQFGFMQ